MTIITKPRKASTEGTRSLGAETESTAGPPTILPGPLAGFEPHPEALAPLGARRDVLQFRVLAGVRQVEGVGDGRHRLKADEIAPRRRVDHGHRIPRAIGNGETAAGRFHPKAGAAIGIADQVAEDVIERPERERTWVGEI